MRFLVLRYLVWPIVRPFAMLAAVFGVCWAIDVLDRIGALGR